MRRGQSTRRLIMAGLIPVCAMALPATARAQWEVGCHAGAMFTRHATGGTAALPAGGAPFTTVTGAPSLHVASWFFGEGAALLNDVSPARGNVTITALDQVLNGASVQRRSSGGFACGISRPINRRYGLEFTIAHHPARLTFTDQVAAAIEASRATFVSVFSSPLPAGQGGNAPIATATATAAVDEPDGYQIVPTALFHVNVRTTGTIVPYATIGGGVVLNRGAAPSLTLTGNYRLTSPPGAPNAGTLAHDETDTLSVRYSLDRNLLVGVIGGGIRYSGADRWGIRLDVRAYLSRNTLRASVDTRASVPTLPAAAVRVVGTNPAIQFSASPTAPPSLGGVAVENFGTFRGSGTQLQVSVLPGLFWRF
jgi:hypothetical protein